MGKSVSSEKAVIVAANPFRDYIITPTRKTKYLGDVEFHRMHLNRHGGVFWDLVPPGRRDAKWGHPEIRFGYFYISRIQRVKYWMNIEYIKRWKEIDLKRVEMYIPEPRRAYLSYYPHTMTYYAMLIRDINPLKQERKLDEFELASSGKNVELVRNYVIITDPRWR